MAKLDVELVRAYRLLEPGPVVLVTAQYRGTRNVMTAAWVSPVSSDPPQVALAVFPGRHMHGLITKSGDFALNIPARPLAEQVHRVGTLTGQETDKFLVVGLTPYEGKRVTAPLIAECLAHLECGVVQAVRTGDHTLFVAEVVSASAEETAFDGEFWTLADEQVTPLNHLGKNWYAWMANKFAVEQSEIGRG